METSSAGHLIRRFLEDYKDFIKIKADKESSIREFAEIDELNDEVWLADCRHGKDLVELCGQKVKLPGRSHLDGLDAVAVEFSSAERQTFGYLNHKGKYSMRLLPIHGSVVLRDRLKVNEMSTKEKIVSLCPAMARVPLPENIKVRHPLLGVNFEEKLELDKVTVQRLRKADEISSTVIREIGKRKSKSALKSKKPSIKIHSKIQLNPMNKVENKKLKKKAEHSESETVLDDDVILVTPRKNTKKLKKKLADEKVLEDLSWLNSL